MRIAHHGISADVPPGWEARIYRRTDDEPGATTAPVLHAATFALPEERGDFGGGAVELMGPGDAFVALVGYDAAVAGTPLFARQGLPRRPRSSSFARNKLQHVIPGQGGSQFFFTAAGRGWCLYVVLGSYDDRDALLARVYAVLVTIVLDGDSVVVPEVPDVLR